MTDPRPGDLFVTRTAGLAAWAIRVGTRSPYNHCGIYLAGGTIGEAQPGGFRIVADHYPHAKPIRLPLTDEQRQYAQAAAAGIVGIPYNWLDIAALAISILLRAKPPARVARRLSRPDRLICSQAVDQIMSNIGVHLFKDGRLPGQVTPADIAALGA